MRNIIINIVCFIVLSIAVIFGLKACDHELHQNELQNLQWVDDANNERPYTNFKGE